MVNANSPQIQEISYFLSRKFWQCSQVYVSCESYDNAFRCSVLDAAAQHKTQLYFKVIKLILFQLDDNCCSNIENFISHSASQITQLYIRQEYTDQQHIRRCDAQRQCTIFHINCRWLLTSAPLNCFLSRLQNPFLIKLHTQYANWTPNYCSLVTP